MEPRPDHQDVREQRRAEKRAATKRKLWGEGAPGVDTDSVWAEWSANAAAHAEAGRSVYVARVGLGHTSAGYAGGQPQEAGGADAAWIVQAVESSGWQLFDVGYVYQTIRERSHVLTDSAQIEGNIIGIYTFRRISGKADER